MCEVCLYREMKKCKKEIKKIMSKVTEATTAVLAELAKATASLDKIKIDEANLAKLIQDLKDQLLAGTLSQADQDALDAVVVAAAKLSSDVKSVDDAVEDMPAPPPAQQ